MSISMKNITKTYDNKQVLHHVNLELHRGNIVGIVGKNGSGKTTLMKILCGNIVNFEGDIEYNNFSSKRKVGYLIESPKFYPNISGLENLKYFSTLLSLGDNASNINEIIQTLDMKDYISINVKKYSLGMKQKLGVAIALLGEPDFLILDEPTNGMDPDGIMHILKYLEYLAKKKQTGILISSHQLDNIQEVSNSILILDNGEIIKNIDNADISSYKLITLKVNEQYINKAKLLLEEQDLNVIIENKMLTFQSKDINIFIQKLSTHNIPIEDIGVKELSLKDLYFNRKDDIINESK